MKVIRHLIQDMDKLQRLSGFTCLVCQIQTDIEAKITQEQMANPRMIHLTLNKILSHLKEYLQGMHNTE